MARFCIVRRVMVAGPGDTADLVRSVFDQVYKWNQSNYFSSELLEPIHWTTHVHPATRGLAGQAEINSQITDGSDILIAVFRHRLGTPTVGHESGSVEEIKLHVESGRPCMIYFSSEEPPKDCDRSQFDRLLEFKSWCLAHAVMSEFGGVADLRDLLSQHLSLLVTHFPVTPVEMVRSLTNRSPKSKQDFGRRGGVVFDFDLIEVDRNDGVELWCRPFSVEKYDPNDTFFGWRYEQDSDIRLDKDGELLSSRLSARQVLSGPLCSRVYDSFKFYLKVPRDEAVIAKYIVRLAKAKAVVTGWGDETDDGRCHRIWFLHQSGFVHPYYEEGLYRINHSIVDLFGV